MIINQEGGPVVPDKTISVFPIIPEDGLEPFDIKNIDLFLKPLNVNHKRDWFTPHFYKCLPLSIGNMQGFAFSLPYTISFIWNGGNKVEDITIYCHDDFKNYENKNIICPKSEFGSGILTIHFPATLKTPPGINLMTIAPPNVPLLGLSPMTGVIESDNIRFSFTLNIKIDIVDTLITILPNTPISAIIPIPRYFCDSFKLENAYNIFDKKIVEEEINAVKIHSDKRTMHNEKNLGPDRLYYFGKDVENNEFEDHQLPKKNKS